MKNRDDLKSKLVEDLLIIAEVGQNHDGSLGQAHAFIDAVAEAGADAIKFQTHIASAESTPEEPWRIKFSQQDERRIDYWRRMEFTEEQWRGLKKHADERELYFLSSAFSIEAVELLDKLDVPAWKIASGEVSSPDLFGKMLKKGRPFILSTGMSYWEEIDKAVKKIKSSNLPLAVLQCTSKYPTAPEDVGLNVLKEFKERYGIPVGISDHSGTIFPGLASVALGGNIVEVHVTFSKRMFGPDVSASITIEELEKLVEGANFLFDSVNSPVDKDKMADELKNVRDLFTKSLVVIESLPKGAVIKREHLTAKKPGTGIPSTKLESVIGCELKKEIKSNTILLPRHLKESMKFNA